MVVVSFWKGEAGAITIGTTRALTRTSKPVDSGVESPYMVCLKHGQAQKTIAEGPSYYQPNSCDQETSAMTAILPIASFDDVGAADIWDGKHLAATQLRPPNPPAICTVSVTVFAVNGGD